MATPPEVAGAHDGHGISPTNTSDKELSHDYIRRNPRPEGAGPMKYVGAGTTPSTGPTSGIETWKRYVLGRWRGMDLGSFGVRNMRGSNRLSVHAVGRAWDWRWADPGPG